MPQTLSVEDSFNFKQELLCYNTSSLSADEFDLDTSGSLCNGALHSKSSSSSESYSELLCNGKSVTKVQYDEGDTCEIKFVPSPSEEENLCGWGPFTPLWVQFFNTPKGVLFFLSILSFLQGLIVNGFINTVITSIERRFDLRSSHSGLIASSYDIAACICLTFVSYCGGNGHKPHWLGWGALIMGIGSLVFALPHFATSIYEVNFSEKMGMCYSNSTEKCSESASSLSKHRFVFMLGQFLHGIGATPLYTLGVTYLDENVKSNYSPVYVGIFYTAAIIGPAVGYLAGGRFLKTFTEISVHTDLSPENPLWVGAWWIGFLGAGAASVLISFPILGYPRTLPGSKRFLAMRVSETHQLKDGSHKTATDPNFGTTVKDLPRSLMLLLKNPPFIFLCLAGATEATLIAGMSTFGPKFLESQFSLSASQAATLFGYLVVPAGGGGTFLGGFIVNKMKLHFSGIIKLCLFCAVLSLFGIFIFLVHCPNMPVAGVTAPYNGSVLDGSLNLIASCNTGCKCTESIYSPVCGSNGVMYYSPCHAACTGVHNVEVGGKKTYYNCSCIGKSSFPHAGEAVAGKCASSCQRMSVLMVFLFVVIFFTFLCSIPALTATLRWYSWSYCLWLND
ncbi:solute carrier organic anion transporter family member 4A1 isoform X2 [Microcaecilia unicolor]|uniref:Solute carrier organic anion transporter family member n=1 Tax=Microcaecilia unicolor TaxID=1415580 RepID=A0A6P7YY21_9AMPH|nr:solute carrier organic anion transporter family member 4A1 isoform X2 [Microcaecilia unicolor]